MSENFGRIMEIFGLDARKIMAAYEMIVNSTRFAHRKALKFLPAPGDSLEFDVSIHPARGYPKACAQYFYEDKLHNKL